MNLITILIYTLLDSFQASAGQNALTMLLSPKITFLYVGSKWKNISVEKTSIFYSSEYGDDLIFTCTAHYPIQWNFTGLLNPPEIAQFAPPERNLVDNLYKIKIALFYQEAMLFPDLGSSVRVACEHVGNIGRDEFYIFVRGNNNQSLVRPKTNTVLDSTLIPCPTKDPTQVTTLHLRMMNGSEHLVNQSNIRYHFTEGFRSNQIFNGLYVCRQETCTVTVQALVTKSLILDDFQVAPNSDNMIRAFTEDKMQFECKSKSGRHLEIIPDFKNESNVNFNFVRVSSHHVIAKVTSRVLFGVASTKGALACITLDDGSVVKRWSYEFVETPELYLDNYRQEVHCLSNVSPKMIQTVRCINTIHCNFMISQKCLENETECNFKRQKQFYDIRDSFCYLPKYGRARNCSTIAYTHLNGLVQCSVAGLVKHWEIFMSLDFLKHNNWKEAQDSELIRMHETEPILYTNKTTQLVCVAAAYLFADSLSFEIEYTNGSRHLLEENNSTIKISRPRDNDTRKIDQLNILGKLDIKLPIDVQAIHCIAPWWNSTQEGLRTYRRFETRHLVAPHLNFNGARHETHMKTFYTEREHNRLKCYATGEPTPTFEWYFKNESVLKLFPKLTTSLGGNGSGEAYLHFPLIKAEEAEKYSGEYKCVAKNREGSVEQRYLLNVTEDGLSALLDNNNVVLSIAIGFTLLILAGVVTMLVIFVVRYNKAKKCQRSLTDVEIDEFNHGVPNSDTNLCSRNNSNYAESALLLPYDKENYEIPLEDLQLDYTVLGSGNFANVVKGKIISMDKMVAVKISKPTADVSTFKTFLSEVKIMTYVGQHDNIVSLIGAWTECIRNRLIYIVIDICELGSLEKFLRESRPSFKNLVNVNQVIDWSLLSPVELPNELNTLNLISLSAQIAKGMEYLQNKGVLHGDLAARNVLLTKERVAKISDFGLSKKLDESCNYVRKSNVDLPWRWMAIECLTTLTFSASSDVWAFGVTLFEIFTLGDAPFPNEKFSKEFIARLASGMRMGRPEYSTQEIYQKIAACWEKAPEQRPSFSTLRSFFEDIENMAMSYVREKKDYMSIQHVQFLGPREL